MTTASSEATSALTPRGGRILPTTVATCSFVLLIIIGGLLRIVPMLTDLPYGHNPDEIRNSNAVGMMVLQRSIDSTIYSYPGLFFNINSIIHGVWTGLTSSSYIPWSESSPAAARAENLGGIVVMRAVSLSASVATIAIAGSLGRRLTNRREGALLAAALVAFSPLDIEFGATITPDPVAGALAAAAILIGSSLVDHPTARRSAAAGALVGLATAAKYNATFSAIAVAAGIALAHRPPGHKLRLLMFAGAFAVAGFIVASPQTLLDPSVYWNWFRVEQVHYRNGHPGNEGNALSYHLTTLTATFGIALLAVPLVVATRGSRLRRVIPVLGTVVAYVGMMSTYQARFDRNMMVVTAPVAALAACGIVTGLRLVRQSHRVTLAAAVVVVALSVQVVAAGRTIAQSQQDPWEKARRFVDTHLDADVDIAVESYGPWLDETKHPVHPRLRIIDMTIDDYRRFGIDHFLVTDQVRQRYANATRYPADHLRYAEFAAATCVVATFGGADHRIELRRLRGTLGPCPPQPSGSS